MSLLGAYVITFIASFCTLVIEMVAGRILAPFVGVSIYTWTSIIGVILAGISVGAYIGGKLVDRFPSRRTLGWLLLLSGAMALLIIPVTYVVASYRFPVSLMLRIFIVTSIIFFVPGCILGTISPVVVRLTLKNLENAGNVIGKIYALSTLGAIVGTFVTGFFFISWWGTTKIVVCMGIALMFVGLFSGSFLSIGLFKKKATIGVIIILLVACPALSAVNTYLSEVSPFIKRLNRYGASLYKSPLSVGADYYRESNYYTIKLASTLSRDGTTPLKTLVLDHLIHSYVNLGNPLHIEYEYERIYADVLKWRFKKETGFKSLTIGGGGYTFPRYMEVYYPNAHIDVVEIDPLVTKVAYDELKMPRNTRIATYNTDGRWYVMNCKDKYDLVFTDAYNDLSIPYHLTTREFARQIKDIMNPDAILMSNIIDNFKKGAFLPSYIKTLQEVFGPKNVHLISVHPDFDKIGISTFIVLASNGALNMDDFNAFLKSELGGKATAAVLPHDQMARFVDKKDAIVITDDYAPIDNLIAPIFEARFGYNRKR
ncbi:MAG TPA: fused MFS/spermidine synthase [Syntrophorhabdaceae bacterium]|nr:fused MFS/spermidine synthase [Syntrophorhabdaceae bacterium]